MTTFELCLSAFLLAFAMWSGIAAFAIADRLLYDRLVARVVLSALRQRRPRSALTPSWGRPGSVRTRLCRPALLRLLLDPAQPDWLRNHVAHCLSASLGLRRLVRDAWGRGWFRSRWRRIGAWQILHRTSAVDLHPALQHALDGADAAVAGAGIAMLGSLGDRRAAEMLVDALRRDRWPQQAIVAQLDSFNVRDSAAVLLPLLDDPAPGLRAWAIALLSHRQIEGLDQRLEGLAGDPDGTIRKAVALAMGEIGSPYALAVAAAMLGDSEGYVRAQAVRSLHRISRIHHCQVAALVAPLRSDHDWWVRLAVREVYAGLFAVPAVSRKPGTAGCTPPEGAAYIGGAPRSGHGEG